MVGAVCSIFLSGPAAAGPITGDVEHPKYKVISSSNNIEQREYAPMIIAEVEVKGERKKAINEGFRLIADYIFGNNTVQEEIPMTAPVQQENTKIAMTAPVQQEKSADAWKVSFVMPSKYDMSNLPKPKNDNIKLKEIPQKQFIVISFSGMNSNSNIAGHEKKLMEYVEKNNIETIGAPKYAFYNPPWILPPMRHNEVMIEIKP